MAAQPIDLLPLNHTLQFGPCNESNNEKFQLSKEQLTLIHDLTHEFVDAALRNVLEMPTRGSYQRLILNDSVPPYVVWDTSEDNGGGRMRHHHRRRRGLHHLLPGGHHNVERGRWGHGQRHHHHHHAHDGLDGMHQHHHNNGKEHIHPNHEHLRGGVMGSLMRDGHVDEEKEDEHRRPAAPWGKEEDEGQESALVDGGREGGVFDDVLSAAAVTKSSSRRKRMRSLVFGHQPPSSSIDEGPPRQLVNSGSTSSRNQIANDPGRTVVTFYYEGTAYFQTAPPDNPSLKMSRIIDYAFSLHGNKFVAELQSRARQLMAQGTSMGPGGLGICVSKDDGTSYGVQQFTNVKQGSIPPNPNEEADRLGLNAGADCGIFCNTESTQPPPPPQTNNNNQTRVNGNPGSNALSSPPSNNNRDMMGIIFGSLFAVVGVSLVVVGMFLVRKKRRLRSSATAVGNRKKTKTTRRALEVDDGDLDFHLDGAPDEYHGGGVAVRADDVDRLSSIYGEDEEDDQHRFGNHNSFRHSSDGGGGGDNNSNNKSGGRGDINDDEENFGRFDDGGGGGHMDAARNQFGPGGPLPITAPVDRNVNRSLTVQSMQSEMSEITTDEYTGNHAGKGFPADQAAGGAVATTRASTAATAAPPQAGPLDRHQRFEEEGGRDTSIKYEAQVAPVVERESFRSSAMSSQFPSFGSSNDDTEGGGDRIGRVLSDEEVQNRINNMVGKSGKSSENNESNKIVTQPHSNDASCHRGVVMPEIGLDQLRPLGPDDLGRTGSQASLSRASSKHSSRSRQSRRSGGKRAGGAAAAAETASSGGGVSDGATSSRSRSTRRRSGAKDNNNNNGSSRKLNSPSQQERLERYEDLTTAYPTAQEAHELLFQQPLATSASDAAERRGSKSSSRRSSKSHASRAGGSVAQQQHHLPNVHSDENLSAFHAQALGQHEHPPRGSEEGSQEGDRSTGTQSRASFISGISSASSRVGRRVPRRRVTGKDLVHRSQGQLNDDPKMLSSLGIQHDHQDGEFYDEHPEQGRGRGANDPLQVQPPLPEGDKHRYEPTVGDADHGGKSHHRRPVRRVNSNRNVTGSDRNLGANVRASQDRYPSPPPQAHSIDSSQEVGQDTNEEGSSGKGSPVPTHARAAGRGGSNGGNVRKKDPRVSFGPGSRTNSKESVLKSSKTSSNAATYLTTTTISSQSINSGSASGSGSGSKREFDRLSLSAFSITSGNDGNRNEKVENAALERMMAARQTVAVREGDAYSELSLNLRSEAGDGTADTPYESRGEETLEDVAFQKMMMTRGRIHRDY